MTRSHFRRRVVSLAGGFLFFGYAALFGGSAPPFLLPPVPGTNGWVLIQGAGASNRVLTLQASGDLKQWRPIAILDPRVRDAETGELQAAGEAFGFVDTAAPEWDGRFYRFSISEITPEHDGKSQVLYPDDAFLSAPNNGGEGDIRWLKFAIVLSDPNRVFYQDSEKYLLHHDYATVRLEGFKGLNRAEFDQASLFAADQKVLLGTVLFPPREDIREYGIQFAGRDPYPGEMVRHYFELVRSTVVAPPDVLPFYFPAYEQSQAAALDETFFAAHGIRVSSVNRWLRGDQVYASGWALGQIRFVPAAEIPTAYADGRLAAEDILLTDGVPAEVPFVAGIISLTPATPNSHVAILARSYAVPFVYLADPSARTRALALAGEEILLQGAAKDGFAQVQIMAMAGVVDPAMRTELLALKAPPKVQIVPKAVFGQFSAPAEQLVPDDIRFFGGKAAQFGLLRRVVPSNSPPAITFSFDLWDAFMDQALADGTTLRDEIRKRLSQYTYPPAVDSLRIDLEQIRELITQETRFSADQQQTILSALAPFDPMRKIRFRSSSNAEDSESFTAAGLYDSYSGCLADDLDAGSQGPCQCDPTESRERGVFRAIQKVYASFYNENAFLERLRHGIDEREVGMAVLAHHSTPDEFELANGVATVWTETPQFGPAELQATLVTQAGAVSVANPEGNARPEIVDALEFGVSLREASSLVPLGSQVMDWPADYETLAELLFRVYRGYVQAESNLPAANPDPILDFEYKKILPGKLLLKQVRPLPSARTKVSANYLLNEPTSYWVYQSETSDVFANHRLKCWLALETKNLRMAPTNLAQCFYTAARWEYRDGTNLLALSGNPAQWPNAAHSVTNDPRRGLVVSDSWTVGEGADEQKFELVSIIPASASAEGLFIRQAEIRKWLGVTYATARLTLDPGEKPATTTTEQVQLVACPDPATLERDTTENFGAPNGVHFELSWLASTNAVGPPLGIDKNFWGEYPAALSPWSHTRITGLISEPIELRGYWSQSARAGHKHRYAWYIFEPRLDPGLSAPQLEELRRANIRLIHVSREAWPGGQSVISILGEDGKFRNPPAPP